MERRSFVRLGLAALPTLAGSTQQAAQAHSEPLHSGEDRFGEQHSLGFSHIAFKVATADTAGGLFLMEHGDLTKGGPYRHLHPDQDEWLYALAGEFIVEIGEQRSTLKPGDSILMPRRIPHVWAQVSDTPGKLLIAFTPAGKMEAFFRDFGKTGKLPTDGSILKPYGLVRVGPPLAVPGETDGRPA